MFPNDDNGDHYDDDDDDYVVNDVLQPIMMTKRYSLPSNVSKFVDISCYVR